MSNPLSNDLIAQFAKAAVGNDEIKTDTVLRGTITRVAMGEGEEGVLCVKIDGSDIETPVSRLPSTISDFKEGDRVEVTVKNHMLTITGNTTSRAISTITEGALRSTISQTASQIQTLVEDTENKLQSSITQNADSIASIVQTQEGLTEFKQTVEGFSFMGGDVKISGGDLILDGCIKFDDLADDTKTAIDNATPRYQYSVNGTGDWHSTMSSSDKYRRESYDGGETWTDAYQFRGTDANIPTYIKNTYIDATEIRSPTIKAGVFNVYPENEDDVNGSFNIYGMEGSNLYHFLKIEYGAAHDGGFPGVEFGSPGGATALWWFGVTKFMGTRLDFTAVTEIDWGEHAPSTTATFG